MNSTERFEAIQQEIQHLRHEMELNRKYIFERPLLIVAGGITAATGATAVTGFDALPIAFVVLLAFNLAFTYNRLHSNSRIIAYLQLVHTPSGLWRWGGWESDLGRYRAVSKPDRDRITANYNGPEESGDNRFYRPIFVFHLVAAIALTIFLLAQVYPQGFNAETLHWPQQLVATADVVALLAFGAFSWKRRPATIRNSIGICRNTWDSVLPRSDPT